MPAGVAVPHGLGRVADVTGHARGQRVRVPLVKQSRAAVVDQLRGAAAVEPDDRPARGHRLRCHPPHRLVRRTHERHVRRQKRPLRVRNVPPELHAVRNAQLGGQRFAAVVVRLIAGAAGPADEQQPRVRVFRGDLGERPDRHRLPLALAEPTDQHERERLLAVPQRLGFFPAVVELGRPRDAVVYDVRVGRRSVAEERAAERVRHENGGVGGAEDSPRQAFAEVRV